MSNSDSTTSRAIPAPNHTQTPNAFFDEMLAEIDTMSELKVTLVIIRQTFGWHKDADFVSLTQLEEMTGMERQQVVAGCKAAIARGYVWREKVGGRNQFGLNVEGDGGEYDDNTPGSMMSIPQASMKNIPTKERVKETPKESTSKDVDACASPGLYLGYLREELDGADVPLLRNREDRYAGEFNKLIGKGIASDVLYKVCDRINERWRSDNHRKLTAEQALEDVVNGHAPKHANTTAAAGKSSDAPRSPIWYASVYEVDFPTVERWIKEGLVHSEIEAKCEGAA